jgi:hypothetical protein
VLHPRGHHALVALRMPGSLAALAALVSWFSGSRSWHCNAGNLQLVTVAAFRRGPRRLLAEMRTASATGIMCPHFSYSTRTTVTPTRLFLPMSSESSE